MRRRVFRFLRQSGTISSLSEVLSLNKIGRRDCAPRSRRKMKRSTTLHIAIVNSAFLILTLSLPTFAQKSSIKETLPKLLPVREQQAVRETWLKKRLDTMLLPMMRQQKIDMWIVINEEFHADPVTAYIAPPLPYVGRRDFFIFSDRGGAKLDRIALVRFPEEHQKTFFEIANLLVIASAALLLRNGEARIP